MITKKNGRAADTGATKKNNAPDKRTDGSAINARVERWRGHIEKELARYAAHGADIPAAWFEEIEQRPMADVITDWVCRERGVGVAEPDIWQQYNLKTDDDYERDNTRARNEHEKRVTRAAVASCLYNHIRLFPVGDELHEFIRHFYRAGDFGIDAAVVRAVKSALAWERDADANAAHCKNVREAIAREARRR